MSLLLSLLCRHCCRPHHRLYRHLGAWNNTFSLHSHYASPTADSEAKKKKKKKRLTSCFQKSARMLKSSSFTHQSTDRCLLFHVHPPPSVSSRCFWQCDKGRNLPTCCWTRRRWVVELPSSVSSREKRDGGRLGGVVDIIIHSTAFPPRSLFFFALANRTIPFPK